MSTVTERQRHSWEKNAAVGDTLADLLDRLGNIPLHRIRYRPPLGTATEKDVLAAWNGPERRLCELVDGVLVEKAMGTREALIATLIVHYLWDYLEENDLGIAIGADGMLRLWRGLVRIPDAVFISWDRLPEGELPDEAIATLVPDLAVEVLSENNTKKEIERKLKEYFQAGTRLAWIVDRKKQTVDVYDSPTSFERFDKNQTLGGCNLLPNFKLPLRKVFSRRSKGKNKA